MLQFFNVKMGIHFAVMLSCYLVFSLIIDGHENSLEFVRFTLQIFKHWQAFLLRACLHSVNPILATDP